MLNHLRLKSILLSTVVSVIYHGPLHGTTKFEEAKLPSQENAQVAKRIITLGLQEDFNKDIVQTLGLQEDTVYPVLFDLRLKLKNLSDHLIHKNSVGLVKASSSASAMCIVKDTKVKKQNHFFSIKSLTARVLSLAH